MRHALRFALFAALVVLPLYALAQTGDPTVDAILHYVPPKLWPVLLAAWGLAFYVVCPLVLKYVKVTPESGAAAKWAVKGSEYITQNTHRPPPIAALLIISSLGLAPSLARAQDTAGGAPVAAPVSALAFPLTADLTLRPNLSVVAFSYDASHKAYLGQGQIAGLYALTSQRLYGAGVIAGGSITFDSSSKPLGEVNAGLVSPKIALSSVLSLHAAVMYARRFGPDSANLLRVAPTLEF